LPRREYTINVVVSKRQGIDGVVVIAEFIPLECADDTKHLCVLGISNPK
jgi:hypothetical protein